MTTAHARRNANSIQASYSVCVDAADGRFSELRMMNSRRV